MLRLWILCSVPCLAWACAKMPVDEPQDQGSQDEPDGDNGEGDLNDGQGEPPSQDPGEGTNTQAGQSGQGMGTGGATGGTAGRGGAGGGVNPGAGGRGGATGAGGGGGQVNTTPIATGCRGYATRFWDCCKPHCGWQSNVPNGVSPMNSCNRSNAVVGSNEQSSCNGGNAHMCYGLTSWAVNAQLAYGFAATSSGNICGRCYQLQFTGESHNAGNDPGSRALSGKTMIVQAINIGYDVSGGQFDIAIPGGGVGAFNACSSQWGVPNQELGAQYGGFLTNCKNEFGGNANHAALKSCVLKKCDSVFKSRGLQELAAGCRWFGEWFEAADNPALRYKEVPCPQALTMRSGMNRSDVNNECGN